jgi:hypothetical protein
MNFAAAELAAWMASIGVMPRSTMIGKCRAFSLRGYLL